MRALHYSLVLLMGLACASTAYADLVVQHVDSPPSAAAPSADRLVPRDPGRDSPIIAGCDSVTPALSPAGLLGHQPWENPPLAPVASSDKPVVRELPALPGSASLFLSAMLTVGAWHTMRKAGQLHLANLPEWYHAGAPQQIGHSVALDLTYGFQLLAVCPFDIPPVFEPAGFGTNPRAPNMRCGSQTFDPLAAPRGPPVL